MQATACSHSNSNPPDLRLLVAQQARQIAMLTELAHIAATPQAEAALLDASRGDLVSAQGCIA